MNLMILSDIHGNLSALEAVLEDSRRFKPEAAAFLGDCVDYGMRSNEVVSRLSTLEIPLACALWGNHEAAVLGADYSRLSSARGRACAERTSERLSEAARAWLDAEAEKSGVKSFVFAGTSFLAVHGSLADPYWGAIAPGNVDARDYAGYDVVLSGHSHIPHSFALFHAQDDPLMRGKRKVVFVNPGSVGQPRDHNPRASYSIWGSDGSVSLVRVPYDIVEEQSLFDGSVDGFYRDRLSRGV